MAIVALASTTYGNRQVNMAKSNHTTSLKNARQFELLPQTLVLLDDAEQEVAILRGYVYSRAPECHV